MRRLLPILALSVAASAAGAQRAALVGTVARDSAGHEIGGAEVRIPGLGAAATTNYLGEFRMGGLEPGRFAVTVVAPGFARLDDSVSLTPGTVTSRDFVLTKAVVLDSTRIVAQGNPSALTGMKSFDQHRAEGHGVYVGDSVLTRLADKNLADALQGRIAGLLAIRNGGEIYMASGRRPGKENLALLERASAPTWCWATIFTDGFKTYELGVDTHVAPPDMARLPAGAYAGVEYYSLPDRAPAPFNTARSPCGTLLLWSRQK